ncbi:MAG: GMC family oxidoreductase, partial [Chlamydiales bacterium]|nr:GMC family oxidoreductase [Chlamydiales bacterium]
DGGLGVGLGSTDLNASAAMIEIVKNTAAANGLTMIVPAPSIPVTADYIKSQLCLPVNSPWHPTGTCKIGTSIINGVVDKNLSVFGVKDLMVVDNSVMPVITTGNTAYPAYVIGVVAASLLGAEVPIDP